MDDYRDNLIEFIADSFVNSFLMIFMSILFCFLSEIGLFIKSANKKSRNTRDFNRGMDSDKIYFFLTNNIKSGILYI